MGQGPGTAIVRPAAPSFAGLGLTPAPRLLQLLHVIWTYLLLIASDVISLRLYVDSIVSADLD
jgi:hypothetical protein